MLVVTQTEKPINLSRIEEIENLVGLKFPLEYKEHLLTYNGGQCSPNIFSFQENGKLTDSCIDWFLAIYDGEFDNLLSYIRIYKIEEKRLPQHILPFAHDPGGNLICISCQGKDSGCIYFWDHEKELDYNEVTDDVYPTLYLIANSFNEFLVNLK